MIESEDSIGGPYIGNGVATSFAYPFPVQNKTHLLVTKTEISTGIETTLVVDTDYTVNGVNDPDSGNWTITLPVSGSPLPSTERIVITPNLPLKQETNFANQGGFFPQTHTAKADYLTLLCQQIKGVVDRCVKVTVGSLDDPATLISDLLAAAASAASSAASAIVSAANALTSENNAATSESNAAASEGNAATSETNAAASASAASTSASSASTSATASASSATNAASSASTASTQATNAASSASAASTSASAASTSASNAASSASSASSSASAASTSASNAATSETNAAASAVSAAASAASLQLRTINNQSAGYTVVSGDRNKLINYTGTGDTLSLTAAATLGSGFEFHVKHSGTGTLTIDPNGSETIDGASTVALSTGQAVVVVCDGSNFKITQARGYGSGAGSVTSVDASGGVETVAGTPITSTGTIRGAILVNAQTGTTYTYLTGDRGKLVTHTNGSAIAGTLPVAGGTFPSGWYMDVQNRGVGTLTITPTTSTIDGAASLALTTGQGCRIVSDGTNYFTQRGQAGAATGIFTAAFTSADQTITSGGLLTLAHGLGAAPTLIQARLKCITNEDGWVTGDEILLNNAIMFSTFERGQAIYADATNVYVRYGAAASVYEHFNQTAGEVVTLTNSNFALVIKAWK